MGPNIGVGEDERSQAYLKGLDRGTGIPPEVDPVTGWVVNNDRGSSVPGAVDGGTAIPAEVDRGGSVRAGR